jgi:hypothetical protein
MIKLYDNKAVEVNGKMFSLMNGYNDYVYCWLDNLPSNYSKTTLDELTTEDIQKEIEEMKYEKEHGIYTIVDDEEWDNDEYFEALDLYIEILEAIKLSFN